MVSSIKQDVQDELDVIQATFPQDGCEVLQELRENASTHGLPAWPHLTLKCVLQPRDAMTTSGLLSRRVTATLYLGIGYAKYPEAEQLPVFLSSEGIGLEPR